MSATNMMNEKLGKKMDAPMNSMMNSMMNKKMSKTAGRTMGARMGAVARVVGGIVCAGLVLAGGDVARAQTAAAAPAAAPAPAAAATTGPSTAGGEAQNPVALLKSSTEKVRNVVGRKVTTLAEFDKRDEDLRAEINVFFDFDELARRAVESHWAALTAEQQKTFLATLRQLIETAYTTRIREQTGFKIDYLKEEVKGDEAFIATMAGSADGKDKLSTDYQLHRVNGRWYVYDLVIEGSSLVRTYKTSFNKIIKQNGYDALVQRMQSKSEDLKKEKAKDREKYGAL